MSKSMNEARLRELLDAYGADLERWPEAEREPARALFASDVALEQLRQAALKLDALLDAAPAPVMEASPALRARVAEVPAKQARAREARGARIPIAYLWRGLMAGVFACVLGVVSGAMTADDASDQGADSADTVNDGWDELAPLALASDFGKEL